MRIAVPYDNENVNLPFGRTQFFKLYDVEDKSVVASQIIDNGGFEHKELITHLKNHSVDVAIVGNIGQHGFDCFKENGIELYTGVSGKADTVVQSYLDGTLELKQEARGCSYAG